METTLRILTRKNLFFLTYLLSFSLYSQSPSELSKQNYREDQFYFGSSYFIQSESIQDFKQNGFSGNFQFGFIRDFPLNNNSTRAIGVGVGYERNFFTSNIQPIIENSEINYRIIVSKFLESKNKLSFSSIVIPIEYRWRTSKIDEFKFWRIYSGFKLKKNFPTLSANEIQICLLLRLQLSSKEIASIKNISVDSLKVLRYRLRKKLNLDSSVKLAEFMNSL